MPWWIPELLRLQRMEYAERMRQMRMTPIIKRYDLSTAAITNFRVRKKTVATSNQSEVADWYVNQQDF